MERRQISEKEQKIKSITQFYYSRPEIQEAIYQFSKNREISPRYFEGFGKRPDIFQFKGDIFGLVKKGATSFHCSEELWSDPLKIVTGMSKKEADKIRVGWDLLIDIDCEEGMDLSARVAKATIEALNQNGIKNVGIKFSGSKGFHIIVPWKAFPKNINGIDAKNLFPDLPRILIAYLRDYSRKALQKKYLPNDFFERFKDKIKTGKHKCKQCGNFVDEFLRVEFNCHQCGITEEKSFKDGKGQPPICYKCKQKMVHKPIEKFFVCPKCEINSRKSPNNFEREEIDLYAIMGLDMGLVSPRHLFRTPYSLHEKSGLVSVVIEERDLDKFIKNPDYAKKIADPLRVKVKNFMPQVEENEAAEFVMQAFDWAKESGFDKEMEKNASGKFANFKPIKLGEIKDSQFPPCIKKLLGGVEDGKKRGLFAILNLFRSIGMEKEELEKRIFEWNEKNEVPLKKGYINAQLIWSYRRKPIMPPNCKEFYKNLGVCSPNKICSNIKNPVNYVVRRNFVENNSKRIISSDKKKSTKNN